jgi:hypothetical protein
MVSPDSIAFQNREAKQDEHRNEVAYSILQLDLVWLGCLVSTEFVQRLLKLKNNEALSARALRKPADKVQPEPLLPFQPTKVQRGTLSAT